MGLIDKLTPSVPFHQIADFPIIGMGMELDIGEIIDGKPKFVLKKGPNELILGEIEGAYSGLFIADGYLGHGEVKEAFYEEPPSTNAIATRMRRLRQSVPFLDIKSRRGAQFENDTGGYFIGDIQNCRIEEENYIERARYRLNIITGVMRCPNGDFRKLCPFHTDITMTIMKRERHIEQLHSRYSPDSTLNHFIPLFNKTVHLANSEIGEKLIVPIGRGTDKSYKIIQL